MSRAGRFRRRGRGCAWDLAWTVGRLAREGRASGRRIKRQFSFPALTGRANLYRPSGLVRRRRSEVAGFLLGEADAAKAKAKAKAKAFEAGPSLALGMTARASGLNGFCYATELLCGGNAWGFGLDCTKAHARRPRERWGDERRFFVAAKATHKAARWLAGRSLGAFSSRTQPLRFSFTGIAVLRYSAASK